MFQKILSNLSSLFKNGGKNWSSMRFAFMVAVLLSNFCFFGLWVGLSIKNNELMKVPESVIVLYALANGISYSGKLIQKPIEKKKDA